MSVTYEQSLTAARHKADEAYYGSPFRYLITKLAPTAIRAHCPQQANVLDVGCGSGRYALFFIEVGVHGTYTGVDISDQRLVDLPLPSEFPGRFVQMDAHEIDTLPGAFDFIISLTAFEHFADDARVLAGLTRVMKPGAKALIVVPAKYSYPLYGRHGYRRYNRKMIKRLAENAGLEIVELRKIGGLASWLFHFNWYFPAQVFRMAGKALLYGVYGMNKERARQAWPRLVNFLDGLGNHHLKWRVGRWWHKTKLLQAEQVDRLLPLAEVGYLTILRRAE